MAERMNLTRDQFLTGSILSGDQHPAVRRRRHCDVLAQLFHCHAGADDDETAIDARAQLPVLDFETALAKRIAHGQHGLVDRQGFLDEVKCAEFGCAHRGLDAGVAGDHDDLRVDAPLS